jgi:pectinesterase
MMKTFGILVCAGSVAAAQAPAIQVRTTNTLDFARPDEIVSIPWARVKAALPAASPSAIRVLSTAGGAQMLSQAVDNDGDGTTDELIFVASFAPKESKDFQIEAAAPMGTIESRAFVRHDDPRDDMAWESDRIAFRVYGEGLKKTSSAMSSSGLDVWVKSVHALVVEKWYGKGHDAYHVDTGEGADFYDVGEALGNGGTAIWRRDTIWRADNFKKWKIIANGPVRAIFQIDYDPWDAGGLKVSETKRIAIDAGQNMYKAESVFRTDAGGDIPYVIGTLKRPGMVGTMSKDHAWAWLTGWGRVSPKSGGHGDLGTAVMLPRDRVADWKELFNHYMAMSHARSGQPVVHYIGAGWTDSHDFRDARDWWTYLDNFADRLASPIAVTMAAGSRATR